jgi:hypothetical protein
MRVQRQPKMIITIQHLKSNSQLRWVQKLAETILVLAAVAKNIKLVTVETPINLIFY